MAAGRQSSKKTSSAKAKSSAEPKKTGSTKSTASSKGSAKGSGTRKSGTKAQSQKKNQMTDEISVLLVLAAAMILLLSNFNLAGSVGAWIQWFMFGLLGVVEYIFPVIVTITLLFLISNKDMMAVARIKTAAVYILAVLLSAVWLRITGKPVIEETSVGGFFTYSAQNKAGGGFLGGLMCKLLSPLGLYGSLVVLFILVIICVIIITERSFIKGLVNVRDSGTRMVHAAKQDYDIYREHSKEKYAKDLEESSKEGESQEEYLARRRAEKEARYQEKEARKEELLARKRAEEERRARARTNRKVLGVTSDTQLLRETIEPGDIDIREIVVDTSRQDEYTADIYEPLQAGSDGNTNKTLSKEKNIRDGGGETEQNSGSAAWQEQQTQQNETKREMPVQNETPASAGTFLSAETPAPAKEEVKQQETSVGIDKAVNGKPENAVPKNYRFPPISLLSRGKGKAGNNQARENQNTAMRLQQTLQNFGVKVTITDISCGPSVTRYELQPEQGVKVSKIVSLSDDIKLNLAAADIRIEAPIPGKAAIGIEVPNKEAGSVTFRELVESDTFRNNSSAIAFAAGKDIAGKIIVADIAKMPHLLIAGATGSGKSVCINTIIMSILYKAKPDEVKLIMVDPKVVELSVYNGIPHLLTPVVTDPKKASGALNWAVAEMADRYQKFALYNVRDLKGYNEKIEKADVPEGEEAPEKMPQIVIIIDELADLMMVAPGEVEDAICRLAQLARAAGIHLVIATQRPSVNVITGLIKANVPSRVAFAVSSGVDSRTIIDMNGAEKLLGKGDMLFYPSGYPKPVRVQGAFVSDEEVGKVVDFLKSNMEQEVTYNEEITNTAVEAVGGTVQEEGKDPYFADAGRFVIEKEKGSIGMLQRYYKIGFNRAGRIMDQLAEAGVVGPELGTKPRKVAMTLEEFEAYLKQNHLN